MLAGFQGWDPWYFEVDGLLWNRQHAENGDV